MSSFIQFQYRYELRHDGRILATGHLTQREPLEVGEEFEINGVTGVIEDIQPTTGDREFRLLVQI